MEGHGWDVKCVQWHPRSSVICSGSKDNLVKVRMGDVCSVDICYVYLFCLLSVCLTVMGSKNGILSKHIIWTQKHSHQGRME